MTTTHDVESGNGRILRVHDSAGPDGSDQPVVFWHHGSPQSGALLAPLLAATRERDLRLVSYGRPGYGGSTRAVGRAVADAGADVRLIADALGLATFTVMGASGGGPHALACAALLPDRVPAAAVLAGIAPLSDEFDWWAGMADDGGLRAALQGADARTEQGRTAEFDPDMFTAADVAALEGEWASLGADAGGAGERYPEGLVDDDVAFVLPWGLALTDVTVPVLLVQGGDDRVVPPAHARWMAGKIPGAELWMRPGDGHISVLRECGAALDWLTRR